MPVRHNIDVMHVEKKVSDALLSILMHNAKSKDGLKARKDLEDMGIRRTLHSEVRGKKTYLPPASYWLSKAEKIRFCRRLSKFRGPDGYCANVGNCVSVEPPAIGNMKSHDHHVLIQNLFHVALRGLLHKGPRIAVSRLCNYFNRLCQRVLDPEMLLALDSEIVETLCVLERFFPPSLFDIMFHLPLHMSREARLGGPVHFRWMYPFERYMKTLKAYVKNFARPEACMAEGYLAGECLAFCLEFLQNSLPVQDVVNRNEDIDSDQLALEGRPLQKATQVTLTDKERDIAHRYILMNTAVMDPYVELHLEELQNTDAKCAKYETVLWKYHNEKICKVDKRQGNKYEETNAVVDHSTRLRWLGFGPRHIAQTYKGYIINGHRFHIDDVKRKTQNSGVTYEAFSMCRSSARDSRHTADIVTFYGVVKEIILLDYHMFQVPLFRCVWANKGNGVKEEEAFTLVNLYMNQSAFLQDPYILASQAKQVFYSREDDTSPCEDWSRRLKPRSKAQNRAHRLTEELSSHGRPASELQSVLPSARPSTHTDLGSNSPGSTYPSLATISRARPHLENRKASPLVRPDRATQSVSRTRSHRPTRTFKPIASARPNPTNEREIHRPRSYRWPIMTL
ncbi:unnamed protein product [Microthlaspi erraticum]|uniref:DUF4218 domain-containing protein n=1 Tax=Microthlaspi erraticum TaxID=1685480 RepID=A0A6D2KDK3_9BRAS|nr:unnamed protein product [Microthlaspi erraticum]